MKILVCGGAGFIGSAFIRNHISKYPDDHILNIDNLSFGSNLQNLTSISNNKNYDFIHQDIRKHDVISEKIKNIDFVINFAAESHVDRSIANPSTFIENNIMGSFSVLEAIRKYDKPLIYVSTDEVYGDASEKSLPFKETDIINPSNPYSASKASAEHLIFSYVKTYGIKALVTRASNNFGPFQFPEKLIPKTIIRALKNLKIPLYGDGKQIRSWIHVDDHVEALESLMHNESWGDVYNITAWNEISNIEIVNHILKILDKSEDLIEFVGDRPAHDKKYSIDSTNLQIQTNWKPMQTFEHALTSTVTWYQQNQEWWTPLADEKTLHPQPWTLNWEKT